MAQRDPIMPTSGEQGVPIPIAPVRTVLEDRDDIRAERLSPGDPIERAKRVLGDSVAAAQDALAQAKSKASHTLSESIDKIQRFADERPLQLVAGVAAVAFVVGIALRIWRSTRYE